MACVTAASVSLSAAATAARTTTAEPCACVHAYSRPGAGPPGFRLRPNRAHLAKAVNSGCWGTMSGCGPSMNYRRWTSGPNMERSFREWAEQASNNMWFPVDVEETAQQYTFVADVPGLGKNDIKVLFLSVLSQSIFDDLDAGLSTRVLCLNLVFCSPSSQASLVESLCCMMGNWKGISPFSIVYHHAGASQQG